MSASPIQPRHALGIEKGHRRSYNCGTSKGNTFVAALIKLAVLPLPRDRNILWARARFFFCKRGLPSPNISANHMARILSTSYVHVHVHTRTVNVCAMLMISYVILKYAPYDWLKCNPRLQKKKSRPGPGSAALKIVIALHCG